MRISICTLFPDIFKDVFSYSIIARAQKAKIVRFLYINFRDFATDTYKTVDDAPYGGGPGMILRVDVADRAIQKAKKSASKIPSKIILLTPQGKIFTQAKARELSLEKHLIFVCGHYEGVDERVRSLVDEELSIGDYVLTGGEIPAMVCIDSIVRLLPNVLTKKHAIDNESFSLCDVTTHKHILEYPQYTRPLIYKKMKVPEVLTSGNHKKILEWKKHQSIIQTLKKRPDLLSEDSPAYKP